MDRDIHWLILESGRDYVEGETVMEEEKKMSGKESMYTCTLQSLEDEMETSRGRKRYPMRVEPRHENTQAVFHQP